MRNSIKYSRVITSTLWKKHMPKYKNIFTEILRLFVIGSIYVLMTLVAIFILYETAIAFYFVFESISLTIEGFKNHTISEINNFSELGIILAEQLLNIVTFILVLVKSFKILWEYAKHQHIEIKALVEISIIALLMEVVFNFGIHSMEINWLFAVLWVTLLLIYVSFPYFRNK